MRNRTLLALVAAVALAVPAARAELKTAAVFSDNMVLQQGKVIAIWGWAKPGEMIAATFGEATFAVAAGPNGKWQISMGPLRASAKGRELVVSGDGGRLTFRNVVVGEVWVCSGQSNMGWTVRQSKDAEAEIADAKNYPLIRLFGVRHVTAAKPLDDTTGAWQVCGPETVASFSGVGYFYGRKLHKARKVPVGLINTSWGGTPAEAWTAEPSLKTVGFLAKAVDGWNQRVKAWDPKAAAEKHAKQLAQWQKAAAKARAQGKTPPRKPRAPQDPAKSPHRPGSLYNGMIAPIVPYGIAGAIWYQGESNGGRAWQYRTLLPLMISNWRADWQQGIFPFLIVELANFLPVQAEPVQDDATWPFLREAQAATLSLPNTALASAIDIGEAKDIHPKNKQEVGRRLALAARAVAYKEKIVYAGPALRSIRLAGSTAELAFNHVGGGLEAKGGELKGFAIAGEDRKWHWATASIADGKIIVSSTKVAKPAAVRYAWANNPIGNLYNAEGLPARPFRTDDWPGKDGARE